MADQRNTPSCKQALRSYDGNCNKNDTLKLNFALSKVFCDYSTLVTLHKIDEGHFACLARMVINDVKAKNLRFTAANSRCLVVVWKTANR